jgi:hypothetical protein
VCLFCQQAWQQPYCQLAPFSSAGAPLQLQAACFPGCVQLLANVFALPAGFGHNTRGCTGGTGNDGGGGDGGGVRCVMTGQARSLAASLLADVAHNMTADGAAAAAEPLPAIYIVVGGAAVSSAAVPAAPEACGITTAPTTPAAAADPASVLPRWCGVSLQWCDLACVTAGQQQQLALHLQLAAAAEGAAARRGGAPCRLLCFNSAGVVVDEQAELQQTLR